MKRKGLVFAGLLGVIMMFCGTVYAEEQASQQNDQQSYNYQTEDGVLSIQAPDSQWRVMSDPNYWFVLSDGSNTITIDHLSNGETLPSTVVASGETEAVCHSFVSTKNEVFVIKGSAVKREDLETVLKIINTIKVLKYDTKTAVSQSQSTAAGDSFKVVPINETYYSTSDGVNVRSGCSTDDAAIGSLSYGDAVTVIGSVSKDGKETGWYQISYNGTTAYVSAQFLSKTKPEKSNASSSGSDEYFLVYGEDGISAAIHSTGGSTYADDYGNSYSKTESGLYYCTTTGMYYALDSNYWYHDDQVNIEGDPYGDLVTGSDGVNIEGDPYGDLVTGSDGVNVEGDPYGDLVTGSDGVNVEG